MKHIIRSMPVLLHVVDQLAAKAVPFTVEPMSAPDSWQVWSTPEAYCDDVMDQWKWNDATHTGERGVRAAVKEWINSTLDDNGLGTVTAPDGSERDVIVSVAFTDRM